MEDKDIQRSKLVNDVLHLYNSKPITKNKIQKKIPIKILNIDTTEDGNKDAALIPKKHM